LTRLQYLHRIHLSDVLQLLDGKAIAKGILDSLRERVAQLVRANHPPPGLAVVLVGEDSASQVYVRNKRRACEQTGIRSVAHDLPADVRENELLALMDTLNEDPDIHGILVQLPLPNHLNKSAVLETISPMKDVDGLHPENVGRLTRGEPRFVPCTPAGILEILHFYQIPVEGADVVIIGRSEIVGKPLAQLMIMHNATVTVCHSRTKNLAQVAAGADILMVAMGKHHFVGADFVKPGAVVIDVGIHRVNDKLSGDVDFNAVSPKVRAITPVPGGVGPMTIAMLMSNLALAAKMQS